MSRVDRSHQSTPGVEPCLCPACAWDQAFAIGRSAAQVLDRTGVLLPDCPPIDAATRLLTGRLDAQQRAELALHIARGAYAAGGPRSAATVQASIVAALATQVGVRRRRRAVAPRVAEVQA